MITNMDVMQKCPICRNRVKIGNEWEMHMYDHYNYCKYGHYEEHEVGDSRWPECMNEKPHLWDRGPMHR